VDSGAGEATEIEYTRWRRNVKERGEEGETHVAQDDGGSGGGPDS
jgi:hypothetical protein